MDLLMSKPRLHHWYSFIVVIMWYNFFYIKQSDIKQEERTREKIKYDEKQKDLTKSCWNGLYL
jgi:hypothetical protein